MALPVSFYGESFNDYSYEKSSFSVAIASQNAGNVVAQAALLATLSTAIDDITLGARSRQETILSRTGNAGALTINPLAQRENKWLVRYFGNTTGKRFSVEIPCADLSLLSTAPQSDFADPTNADIIAFKAAFEAVVKSPDDSSEAVTILNIQFVGRRN